MGYFRQESPAGRCRLVELQEFSAELHDQVD